MGTDGQVVLDRAASETKKLCASRREIHRAPSGLWPPGALALLAPDLTFLARNLAHAAKSGDVGRRRELKATLGQIPCRHV
jgi:hypothetical protein